MRSRLVVFTALAAAAAVGGAACGDDGQSGATLPPIVTTTTSTTLPPTTTTMPKRYTVKRGDTLQRIAKIYGLDVGELMKLNEISNPDHIFRGQILKFPPPTIPPSTTAPSTTTTTIDAG